MKSISAKEVEIRLAIGEKLHIIDVREPFEAARGLIPGAVNIPLGELLNRWNQLDQTKEYILVCESGSRSYFACDFLEGKGIQTINMAGGMLDWQGETK